MHDLVPISTPDVRQGSCYYACLGDKETDYQNLNDLTKFIKLKDSEAKAIILPFCL